MIHKHSAATIKNVLILTLSLTACITKVPANDLEDSLRCHLKGRQARVGIAIVADGKVVAKVNNGRRYPLMSVFKLHQAMFVANVMEQCGKDLDSSVLVAKNDLTENTYSPLRDKHPDGGFRISIADLLRYSLQHSDNNACDILFKHFGSPSQADSYIRTLGYNNFRIKHNEKEMHKAPYLCRENWSSPSDAALLIYALYNDKRFKSNGFSFIRHCMEQCHTGTDRIAAPLLGTNAIVAHKTGTGGKDKSGRITAVNDVAYIMLPNNRQYSIAVFAKDSDLDLKATSQLIAELSKVVYRWYSNKTQEQVQ